MIIYKVFVATMNMFLSNEAQFSSELVRGSGIDSFKVAVIMKKTSPMTNVV